MSNSLTRSAHPVLWQKIRALLGPLEVSASYVHTSKKTHFLEEVNSASVAVRQWLAPVVDLTGLPYAYPVSGITEAINQWLQVESRKVQMFLGDYNWPVYVRPSIEKISSFEQIDRSAVVYFSNPNALNGNYDSRWPRLLQSAVPIILDCAFVGSTEARRIELNGNVEQVFFSFSKGFGLNHLRVGWKFCRKPDELLEKLLPLGYYNSLIPAVSLVMTENVGLTEFFDRARPYQREICADLGLQPSDSYLLGLDSSGKYESFLREDGKTSRVCISSFYSDKDLPVFRQGNC